MAPKLNRKEWTRGPEQNSREFNATVCKKDGEDYKPEPLVWSVYCYWLYITEKEYKYLITLFVTEFKSWKQVLEGYFNYFRNMTKASGRTGESWHDLKMTKNEKMFACISSINKKSHNFSWSIWDKSAIINFQRLKIIVKSFSGHCMWV